MMSPSEFGLLAVSTAGGPAADIDLGGAMSLGPDLVAVTARVLLGWRMLWSRSDHDSA